MSINFDLNNRINEMLAKAEHLPDDTLMPGFGPILVDVIAG
jgi:hypothetical protein